MTSEDRLQAELHALRSVKQSLVTLFALLQAVEIDLETLDENYKTHVAVCSSWTALLGPHSPERGTVVSTVPTASSSGPP